MPTSADAPEVRKRFYAQVAVVPAESGFAVTLDGRTPRSAEGAALVLPTLALAELAAEEWAAQDVDIIPSSMMANRLAWTGIAFAGGEARAAAARRLGEYAGSDLLCYFADGPAALVERQQERWGELILWAKNDLGSEFHVTQGIVHRPQPEATVKRIETLALAEDPFALAGLMAATPLLGSTILAFALRRGEIDGATAHALSRLDEAFQEERWGVDAEAAARTAAMAAEAATLERWFAAL